MNQTIERLLHIALFAFIFSFVGYSIPQTYYQYLDKTVYYQIQNPIPVEHKNYKSCEYVDVYIIRNSLIDGQGDSIINLSLVREGDNTRERIAKEVKTISITKGDGTIITHWQLPCSIPAGKYFFEGTIKYQIRNLDKFTAFNTEIFEVKE